MMTLSAVFCKFFLQSVHVFSGQVFSVCLSVLTLDCRHIVTLEGAYRSKKCQRFFLQFRDRSEGTRQSPLACRAAAFSGLPTRTGFWGYIAGRGMEVSQVVFYLKNFFRSVLKKSSVPVGQLGLL